VINQVAFYLSGGAANADPNAALGGDRSSTRVLSQSAAWADGSITGLTLVDAAGNTAGQGTLTYDPAYGLAWRPPGVTFQTNYYALTDSAENVVGYLGQTLTVDVVSASLPGTPTTELVDITAPALNTLYDDVTKAEAVTGRTEYRGLYCLNLTGGAIEATVWLKQKPASGVILRLGLEPQIDAAQTIADEATPPAGIAFSEPYSEGAGLTLNLASGQAQGIWIERDVPALLISTAIDRILLDYSVA
jgi:hypothetical protein